jgi:hypothetical protein
MQTSTKRVLTGFALLLAVLFARPAAAQTQTTVSGTVTDPNGIPYAGARLAITLVSPGGPSPSLTPCNNPQSGCQIQNPSPVTLDATGSFVTPLWANGSILPASTTYNFCVTISPGVAPPFGTGPQSYCVNSITVSGATQTITFSSPPALTVPFSGSGGVPAGNVGDVQIKATSSTFGAGHINDSGTTLSFSENVLASASENIGLKYGSGDSYCYVDSSGNDSLDGLSPGTAKLTIMACYDALPTQGGTISICAQGGAQVFATATASQGIWIAGPTDPNYSSLPAGWRKAKAVYFLGSCGNDASSEGDKPGVLIAAGNSVNPEIWLSSNGLASLTFENLFFTSFPPIAVQIGLDSNGNQTSTSGVVGVRFENVLTTVCTTSSGCGGPGWLIGGGDTFNLTLDHVNVSANTSATTGSDQQAAILVKPASSSNAAVGLAVLSNSVLAGGPFKFYQGTNGSGFTINHVLSEGIVGPTTGTGIATVWLAASSYSDVLVEDVTTSDQTNEVYDVRNDGGITAASSCTAVGDFTAGIFGPCTIVGTINTPVSDPLVQGQTGFLGGRSYGFTTATQRQFGPSAVRWTNLAPTLSSSWTATQSAGTTTYTQGLTALDGCTGAGTPTSTCVTGAASASNNSGSSTPIEFLQFLNASSISISVGDWFIGGFWERQPSGGPSFAQVSTAGSLVIAGSGNTTSCSAINTQFTTDGDWEWVYQLCKVTAVGTTPAPVSLQAQFTGLISVEAYAPILIHIPTGQVSQGEAYEIANNLTSYNSSCAVSTICGLSGTIGSSVSFAALTTGVNTGATMTVGSGASLVLTNATGFAVPSAASFVSTSTREYGIDSGANNVHIWNGAADLIDLGIASVPNNGDVLGASISSSTVTAQDLGGVAGGGNTFLKCTLQAGGPFTGDYFGVNSTPACAELTPTLTGVAVSASGTTIIATSNRGEVVKASSTSGAQTFAQPDATTTGFAGFYDRVCNHGTVGPLTLTNDGGSFTFSAAASPYSLPEGYCTDMNPNSTNTGWTMMLSPGLLTAGSGIALTQTQFGTTLLSNPPYVAAAGSVNVLTGAYSPAIVSASLVAGFELEFLPNIANTSTTPTFNPSGLGAATITKNGTSALAAGDLTTTAIATVKYDGTHWQLQNPQTANAGTATGGGSFQIYGIGGSIAFNGATETIAVNSFSGIDTQQSFADIAFRIATDDATTTDLYSIGIAGPCAPNTASCPVLCSTTAQDFTTAVQYNLACSTGTMTVPTSGQYYYIVTASGAGTAAKLSSNNDSYCMVSGNSSTAATAGQIPANVEIPAATAASALCSMPAFLLHN